MSHGLVTSIDVSPADRARAAAWIEKFPDILKYNDEFTSGITLYTPPPQSHPTQRTIQYSPPTERATGLDWIPPATRKITDAERVKELQQFATAYCEAGWGFTWALWGKKSPGHQGWQKDRVKKEEVPKIFAQPRNIAMMFDGGLVDIDLDCAEARRLAPYFLPRTAVFGRHSSPNSHWAYICEEPGQFKKFEDPHGDEKSALVEFRTGEGKQTIFPPSRHEGTGEDIVWNDRSGKIARVNGKDLFNRTAQLATAALLLRNMVEGRRNELLTAMTGVLLRSGWMDDAIEGFLKVIADATDFSDYKNAAYHRERLANNENVFGILKLKEILGEKSTGKVLEWLLIRNENGNEVGSMITEQGAIYRCLADVEAKPISWLWPGRIAQGKVSMIAGNPGLGKSQVTLSMAAIVTTGGMWPIDRLKCEEGNVIFVSAEDDPEDTIRPRLEATGGKVKRVFILDAVREGEGERAFNLKSDLARLESMMQEIGMVRLIIIDPISAYLGGKTDAHKDADVRALLHPLSSLAARHNVAVVCVSHLNKGGGSEALLRVSGSIAFTGAARSVWTVVKDSTDPKRRLFLPAKNNLGDDVTGLAFRIEGRTLKSGITTSCVYWESEAVTTTADEALQALQCNLEEGSALNEAVKFLKEILANGPVGAKQVLAEAKQAGVKERTLERAKPILKITSERSGPGGSWQWHLPIKGKTK